MLFDSNNYIEWTYTASGAKLRKIVFMNGVKSYTKNYVGGFEYKDNTLEYFATSEGRVVLNADLGNVRVTFDADGTVVQTKSYYPFWSGDGRLGIRKWGGCKQIPI